MMKNTTRSFGLLMLMTLTLFSYVMQSCGSDDGETVDTALPPTIVSFSPQEGAVGTTVIVTGTNLEGATAKLGDLTATVASTSATQVNLTIPANAETGRITLMVGDKTVTSATDFTVTAVSVDSPMITSFDPKEGSVGTPVKIEGDNLDGVTSVTIAGATTITDFTIKNKTRLTFLLPEGSTVGSGTIVVTSPAGSVTSDSTFEIIEAKPIIESLSVNTASRGQSVVITGQNFDENTKVFFNDVEGEITQQSSLQLTVTVPSGTSTGKIKIVTAKGEVISADDFNIVQTIPALTRVTNMNGVDQLWATRESSFRIEGTFLGDVIGVKIDNNDVTISEIIGDSIIVVATGTSATSGKLEVVAPGGIANFQSGREFEIVKVFPASWFDGKGDESEFGPLWVNDDKRNTWLAGQFVKDNGVTQIFNDDSNADGYVKLIRSAGFDQTWFGDHKMGGAGIQSDPFWSGLGTDPDKIDFRMRLKPIGDVSIVTMRWGANYKSDTSFTMSNGWGEYAFNANNLKVTDTDIRAEWPFQWGWALFAQKNEDVPRTAEEGGVCIDYLIVTERID